MDDNEEIIKLLKKRLELGKKTYDQGVRVNDGHDWEQEALEEVLDGLIYAAAAILKLKKNRFTSYH